MQYLKQRTLNFSIKKHLLIDEVYTANRENTKMELFLV